MSLNALSAFFKISFILIDCALLVKEPNIAVIKNNIKYLLFIVFLFFLQTIFFYLFIDCFWLYFSYICINLKFLQRNIGVNGYIIYFKIVVFFHIFNLRDFFISNRQKI